MKSITHNDDTSLINKDITTQLQVKTREESTQTPSPPPNHKPVTVKIIEEEEETETVIRRKQRKVTFNPSVREDIFVDYCKRRDVSKSQFCEIL